MTARRSRPTSLGSMPSSLRTFVRSAETVPPASRTVESSMTWIEPSSMRAFAPTPWSSPTNGPGSTGVPFGDDDVVRGDFALVDRCGCLGCLEFLVERERVLVGSDDTHLSLDVLDEVAESGVLERTRLQGVAADAQHGGSVQVAAHILELLRGNAGDADDADALVLVDNLCELVDFLFLPLGKILGFAFGLCAHSRPPPRTAPSSSSRRRRQCSGAPSRGRRAVGAG